jgi:hypothetical protein
LLPNAAFFKRRFVVKGRRTPLRRQPTKLQAPRPQPKGQIMTAIVDIAAREILDSRGNPTVDRQARSGRIA